MEAKALKVQDLTSKIYLIEGNDRYWLRFAVEFFKGLVPNEYKDFNLKIIDNLKGLGEVEEAVSTVSMFFDCPTVVIVRDEEYKENEDDKKILARIFETEFDGYLVFCRCNFITPSLKKRLCVIDASKLDVYQTKQIIKENFNTSFAYNSLDLLIEYTGGDMDRICNELQKLAAYTGGKKSVTATDIEELVANTIENDIFELTNAMSAKNHAVAMRILDRFNQKGVSKLFILASLIALYRRMLHSALSSKPDKDLAADLGVKEYAIKKTRELAKKYTKRQLKQYLDALINAEYLFKSGVTSEESAFRAVVSKLIV